MSVDNDLWIDLQTLYQGSFILNGHVVFFNQYNNKIPRNDSIMYLMRKAVRAVEFKITKIRHIFGSPDREMVQEEFHADIPEALWESKSKVYSDWTKDTIVELS